MRIRLATLLGSAVLLLLACTANGKICNGCGIYDDAACPSGCVDCAKRSKCCTCTEGGHWCHNHGCPSGYSHFTYATCWACCDYEGCRLCRNKNTGRCNTCVAGKYKANVGSVDQCKACAPGKYNPSNGGTCINCPKGKYQTLPGQTNCPKCDAGRYNPSTGRGPVCQSCEPGKYNTNAGFSYCSACQSGRYQRSYGQRSCPNCLAGTYSGSGRSYCGDCAAGRFSDDAAPSCTACSAGTFTPYRKQRLMCQMCVGGRYMPNTGATRCLDCARGKFSTEQATSSCVSPPCSANCLEGDHIGYTSMIRGGGCSLKSRYDEQISDYDGRCANGKPAMQDGCKILCSEDWYDEPPLGFLEVTTLQPTRRPTHPPTTPRPTTPRPTRRPTPRPTWRPTSPTYYYQNPNYQYFW